MLLTCFKFSFLLFISLLSQMGVNPFRCRYNDLSDRGQARRQRDESDAGRASKVPPTERVSRERGVPLTPPDLEGMPISRKKSR